MVIKKLENASNFLNDRINFLLIVIRLVVVKVYFTGSETYYCKLLIKSLVDTLLQIIYKKL